MIYVTQQKSDPHLEESFAKSFKTLLTFANCLGLLPTSWKSWNGVYTFVAIIIYVINTVFCIINWTFVQFSFRLLARQMHQINAFTSLVLYFRLAKKWPKLVKLWTDVDTKMRPIYGYPKNLNNKIKIATVMITAAAFGEYVLLIVYQIGKITIIEKKDLKMENYYMVAFPEMFSVVPFNTLVAIFASVTSMIGHMIWSFNDLFIVAISVALASRFKQITNRLYADEKKSNTHSYWVEIRADYNRLVQLSRKLDKYISYIVLLSYSANIFFLLIQLSNVIGIVIYRHFNYDTQVFYYTYSFSFLIARLTAVSLCGASIVDESKEPASVLNSVPSATYNLEVAGAIVTYELVIIQFNNSEGLQ